MPLIQTTRQRRHPILAVLTVAFYLMTAAIVPPGHMAASLDSGTAFHLCPGDARSSLIIDALSSISMDGDHGQHHGGHHQTADPAKGHGGAHGSDISETSGDPGCIFSGVGNAVAYSSSPDSDVQSAKNTVFLPAPRRSHQRIAWLRPPVRSPPV
ncbi:hypothetical protein [Congregibacter sp.]|uniref:hypothetical protein n=1 Tax=Congregibacter sp. TaxID=2744308 RepID=UPI003F6D4C2A